MEKALRYELNKIYEINNKIYPTNAPEGEKSPYVVYITRKSYLKTFEGTTNDKEMNIVLNIFCDSYSKMKGLTKKIEDIIKTFPLKIVGIDKLYIENLTFEDITETYENELKLYRGIIPFKVCYKEE